MADDLDFGATIKGFSPGQKVLGRYKLVRILGRGGMGVVWLARDEELEREVALKFLPEIVALDPEAVADMKRETRRNLDLTHPHIVRIHDFMSDGRTAAISMEYVNGASLSALKLEKADRIFTPAELRPWLEQLIDALHYAHAKAKVVHRDLKPANLMITREGDLKVADFGIARGIADSVSRVSVQAGSSGTPVYMSPQQMLGEKAAVTDDIYALGATLYELLTSKPPFYSGNVILQVQSKAAPSMAERRKELDVSGEPIPAEWEETIAACLAKEAKDRPQGAGEVAERLELTTKDTKSTKQKTENDRKGRANRPAEPQVGQLAASAEASREGRNLKTLSPANGNALGSARSTSKTPLYASLIAGVLLLAGLGYYFGIYVPEQDLAKRQAASINAVNEQKDRIERERTAAEALGVGGGMGKSAKPKSHPQPGQPWTIPDLNLMLQPIAPGTFTMGSASGRSSDERPLTQVTITKPYWLGQTEVTQAQWQAVMGSNPSNIKGDNLPVEHVSWNDAMEFCRKLTERERAAGRTPEGHTYTLPTEAQWEYACRAGTTGDYAGSLDPMGWYAANSGSTTQPVGQKQANAWGLHDMHGNVWEWCADLNGNYPGGVITDPTGPPSGSLHVTRGGGWDSPADNCRSSLRNWNVPGARGTNLGFRLALSSVR